MECIKCGGRINELAETVALADHEGDADLLIHVECCDDPAELPHLQFQKWAAWMLRSLIHEAYGHRWAVLGLIDAMDEAAPQIADAYRARQARIPRVPTPEWVVGDTERLLREAVEQALDAEINPEDILQIVYLRMGQWLEDNQYPRTPWYLAKSLDALRSRIGATSETSDEVR